MCEPRPCSPYVAARINDEIDALSLLANGATTSFAPKLARRGATSLSPVRQHSSDPGDRRYSTDPKRWRLAFDDARTNWERVHLWGDLVALRRSFTHAPKSLKRDTLEWKTAIASDERSARLVGSIFGVNHSTVIRYRKTYGGVTAPPDSQVGTVVLSPETRDTPMAPLDAGLRTRNAGPPVADKGRRRT
jgi:hypothetical protein